MKILLINANPVVSRLLVLCTRDESVVLDEAVNAGMVKSDDYDIVLVDEASYGRDVANLLSQLDTCAKVFISYRNEPMRGFEKTIKKPFLPSQITELIENLECKEEVENSTDEIVEDHLISPLEIEETEKKIEIEDILEIFPLPSSDEELDDIKEDEIIVTTEEDETPIVLDSNEIDKIKALLDMDDEELISAPEILSDDEYEIRKIEVIKEQLIADGLEILCEDDIVEELHEKSEKKNRKSKNKKSNKNKKKEIGFTEEELESIEDAIEVAVGAVTQKQMKKLLKGKKIKVSIEIEGDK